MYCDRMQEGPIRILVVEDDPTVSEVVEKYLRREGYRVEVAVDGKRALEIGLSNPPDLMVLDLMLPHVNGFEVCRQMRALAPVPVIMLTARGQEIDRVIGLEFGADDYLSKPFSPRELMARVKAVLRRARGPLAPVAAGTPLVLVDGDLIVDVPARQARQAGEVVPLTAREFELLAFLIRHAGQAFRREELLEQVWGSPYWDPSTVTVHVRRLREKIEPDTQSPQRIVTVWGVGYRWEGVESQVKA